MAEYCKKGTAANWRISGLEGHRFETRCQQGLFTVESPIKFYPSSCVWIYHINLMRCTGWLYICFTCQRCNTCSIKKSHPGWWLLFLKQRCTQASFFCFWIVAPFLSAQERNKWAVAGPLADKIVLRGLCCGGVNVVIFFTSNISTKTSEVL